MRVRKKINGLRVFGGSQLAFWVDVPDGPAQVAGSRMGLWQGQWFLNLPDGMPYQTQVLGTFTGSLRDVAVQSRILGTPGLAPANPITNYSSSLDRNSRIWSVNATLNTAYGSIIFSNVFTGA